MASTDAGEQHSVLRLDGITKRFGALTANDGISLSLRRGEILGLLGENGAGKTTLMNILFGHYVADEGVITVEGHELPPGEPKAALAAGVGMVHQHFTLAENLTVLDNIVLGTESLWRLSSGRAAARARIAKLGEDFGLAVNPSATIASLSVGERQRVEILKALYRNARILILDEPTAVLTPQESAALFDTLKKFVARGLSIIFISHKLGEVLSACSRVAILRGGRLVAERPVAGVTRGELAELMVGRAIPQTKAEPQAPGAPVLVLAGISLRQGTQKLDDVNLTLHAGQVLGIAGVSGNGQSLLADVVSGVAAPAQGSVRVGEKKVHPIRARTMIDTGVARIPEDRHAEGLIGDMTVAENVVAEVVRRPPYSSHGLVNWRAARDFAAQIIADYEVKCPSPEATVRLLSGGNMQKLILGRVMAQSPAIILANQPTRGLDVGAVTYVHQQLLAARKRGAAVLLISEDLDELLSLADVVSVMYHGALSAPVARGDVTIQGLGLLMAGHGFAAAHGATVDRGQGHAA